MTYESDEDDQPLVFKRSNTSTNQNHLNPGVKSSSSQNHDGKSGGQIADVRSYNGQNSNIQKGKTVPFSKSPQVKSPLSSPIVSSSSAKASPVKSPQVKSPLTSPIGSSSSAKASPVKSPVANAKASTSTADKSKHSSQQNSTSVVKEENVKTNNDSEDSEDEKPLSSRLSAGLSKGNSNHAKKGPSTSIPSSSPSPKPRVKDEDSDDEKPLTSKIISKFNTGASTSKIYDSDDEKPLSSKLQQNGSAIRDNQIKKPHSGLNKRPPNEVKSSSQSSVKKPKLSDASTPINSRPIPVKAAAKPDDDENDHIPISQRMKKPAPSGSKSSSVKQKVTKVVSSSFKKTTKNSKKVIKKSKYSKSSNVPPGSGEGQKWTSLVHNGVIFPPPYKPHGVKMLYKGKPVDLTPEQEEVATMFAVMRDTDYMTKPQFRENFMTDWRKILGKNHIIQNLDDCDFTPIYDWHQKEKDKKKEMSTEEKKAIKEEKMKQEEKYMWAVVDGVREKVGNFRVEPPGLFRGRGEHPKV